MPLSSVQVTFCLPVQPKGQARLSITSLTYPFVFKAITARSRSVAHRVEVTTTPPTAQVHGRSHVVSRSSGCTACLHCISFDDLSFRDCLRSRSERSRPHPLFYCFRLAVCVGDAQAGSLSCIAYWSRYLLREGLRCCSCQCSRALPLSRERASALHKAVVSATVQGNLSLWRGYVILIDGHRRGVCGEEVLRYLSKDRGCAINRQSPGLVTTQSRRLCGTQRQQRTVLLLPKLAW